MIHLKQVTLPDFGMSEELPEIPSHIYEQRIEQTLAAMQNHQLDFLLVFADREHAANITFLCNLDPRFEEALFMLSKNGNRKLLVGNECIGYLPNVPIPIEAELYQDFSLQGQDRSKSRSLLEIFNHFGIKDGCKVGIAYYKSFGSIHELDIPAYMANTLSSITGSGENLVNVNFIFMDAENGLRNRTCLEELVRFEYAATRTSESLKRLLQELEPGIREYELARNYQSDGLPLSCHPMVSSGQKAAMGLSSPSAHRVNLGDPFTCAFGIWGALNARAGMVVEKGDQMHVNTADFYERFWENYFEVVSTWYESVRIGATAGSVFQQVEAARDVQLFDFALNPGHTIHIDEWVDSPFILGRTIKLYSGMALQMDIIPVSKGAFVCCNMEDGIVLADAKLRHYWASKFPESMRRIHARQSFMRDELGINIHDDVLPLSNIPAYYTPYLLLKDHVAVKG